MEDKSAEEKLIERLNKYLESPETSEAHKFLKDKAKEYPPFSNFGLNALPHVLMPAVSLAMDDWASLRLKELEENKWIDVKTEMPPRHKSILCLNIDGRIFEGRVCYGFHKPFFTYPHGDGSPSNTAPSWINVTHWMPLPLPPKPLK